MTNLPKQTQLYIVFFESATDPTPIVEELNMVRLSFGLFLVHSRLTQSKLYHKIKWAVEPENLFVGKLKEPPKFKGMEAGTLKWLRSLPDIE